MSKVIFTMGENRSMKVQTIDILIILIGLWVLFSTFNSLNYQCYHNNDDGFSKRLMKSRFTENYNLRFHDNNLSTQFTKINGRKGVNIYGWLFGDFGGGRTVRTIIRCLQTNNVSFVAVNITGAELHSNSNQWVMKKKYLGEPTNYSVDIIAINAANTEPTFVRPQNRINLFRYTIGIWHWETSYLPQQDGAMGKYYNEIWVPSQYIADAIAATSTFPRDAVRVFVFPYGYESLPNPLFVNDKQFARTTLLAEIISKLIRNLYRFEYLLLILHTNKITPIVIVLNMIFLCTKVRILTHV